MVLPDYISRLAVSSVLNRNTQLYGKAFLFDGNPETCWQSDPHLPQWIMIEFKHPVRIASLKIQFQGGFAAEEAELKLWTKETVNDKTSYPFYPTNSNNLQTFEFTDERIYTNAIILFQKGADFFGRIIVYQLNFTFS